MDTTPAARRRRSWVPQAAWGIVAATFFSDFSHEMATAVLPLYLATVGLGPAALGAIEGVADFVVSLSKLAGGAFGQRWHRRRAGATAGYVVTAVATAGLGLAQGVGSLVALRTTAWFGRGFRSPLRDALLAEAVPPTHFGRVYGLERAADMLGAVAGPLVATAFVLGAVEVRNILLWSLVPGLLAAASMGLLTRGLETAPREADSGLSQPPLPRSRWPRLFLLFLIGVVLFGLGDFSRTFLVWLGVQHFGGGAETAQGAVLSLAVLLYAAHNLTAAVASYPVGRLGDRFSRLGVLTAGYGLGTLTHALLIFGSRSTAGLVAAFVLSGLYIAVEETLEKAVAAELLPAELRSLGFGFLAVGNAIGDLASSLVVGILLEAGRAPLAFGLAAGFAALGCLWLLWLGRGRKTPAS